MYSNGGLNTGLAATAAIKRENVKRSFGRSATPLACRFAGWTEGKHRFATTNRNSPNCFSLLLPPTPHASSMKAEILELNEQSQRIELLQQALNERLRLEPGSPVNARAT